MAIKTSTRKKLWARSGNRCALCHIELVPTVITNEHYIIGRECHIISSELGGPRGKASLHCKNHDDYENLLLLCPNHHNEIDSLTEKYTVDNLLLIKTMHEEWVRATLSNNPTVFTNKKYGLLVLNKIESGSELVKLVDGSMARQYDNLELTSNDEFKIISALFDNLEDYLDVFHVMNFSDKARLAMELNDTIKEIERLGLFLFGLKREIFLSDSSDKNIKAWDIATIVAVKNTNHSIVDKFLLIKTPVRWNIKDIT